MNFRERYGYYTRMATGLWTTLRTPPIQDPIAFLKQGGVKGIQLRTLPPGLWPIHPYLFRMSIAKTTMIPQGKVGVVSSADGAPLDRGRLLGKAIDGHRNFQDAEQYIASGGQKGPQVDILTPGTYRIQVAVRSGHTCGAAPPGTARETVTIIVSP